LLLILGVSPLLVIVWAALQSMYGGFIGGIIFVIIAGVVNGVFYGCFSFLFGKGGI